MMESLCLLIKIITAGFIVAWKLCVCFGGKNVNHSFWPYGYKVNFYQETVPFNIYSKTFEPPHDKTNKMACAPSEASDQHGHPPSLIRVFAVRMKNAWVLSYRVHSEDSDQTGRMPKLTWVFAGHTGHFVRFVIRRLIICLYFQKIKLETP